MPRIELSMEINAPIDRVFDLARSVDMHVATQTRHREEAIAGVTSGLMEDGDSVTWRATHLGIRQSLTSEITLFSPPHHFRDSMVQGAFARFDHDHRFEALSENATLMTDIFDYTAPLGWLGRIADFLFLERKMRRLLLERNAILKEVAESGRWRDFLEPRSTDSTPTESK